jgi:gamma-glutamyl-gamma-aminobutyrate hydrolase PuuD
MPKPLIGITTDYLSARPAHASNYSYSEAVAAAGGIPVLLPFHAPIADIPELVSHLDGVLFSGGDDLNPAAWGEETHPNASPIDPAREAYERALLSHVESLRLPTLGICLGAQLFNVHRGGSLHQFIPELPSTTATPRLEHRRLDGQDARHPVSISPNSLLAQTLGQTQLESNSAHKQAFHRIGQGLTVTAHSPDGIPEALEDATFPLFLAVQWHPERIHTQAPHDRLFKLLVTKANQRNR